MSTSALWSRRADPAVRLLVVLLGLHALVDLFAASVQPLWPDFQVKLGLSDFGIQGVFLAWSLATSFSQLAFGLLGDRMQGRFWLWAGPALGILGMSLAGTSSSVVGVVSLLILGGLGIAAFHPEAAALAGDCAPSQRSRALSLFTVGGFLGQALGPSYSGPLTTAGGLPSLAWGLAWGLPVLLLLSLALPRLPAEPHRPAPATGRISILRGLSGRGLWVVLGIAVLRVIPGIGVPQAVAYSLKAQGATNAVVGTLQTVFFAGIGLGSLASAFHVRHGSERQVLTWLPLGMVLALALCPFLPARFWIVPVGLSGLLLGGVTPILVGYGQRVLPHGQRVASAITMGVSWGIGGLVVAALMGAVNHLGRPHWAFGAFALATAASCLLCVALPAPKD